VEVFATLRRHETYVSLPGDIRLGFRTLVKNPGFTAVAVATLAVGIGVNATVFTVTDAALFKGFPLVSGNDRIRYIGYKNSNCCVSYPDFLDWKAQSKSFDDMAIVHGVSKVLGDATGFPERLDVTEVSANTFRLVGQKPILGRDFSSADEAPGAAPITILNYGYWERRFGKDPTIIGRTVRMSGALTTVVGVMPPGFTFPQKLELWVPLVQTPRVMQRENRDTWMAIGHLAEGVTMESAQVEMEIIGKRLALAYPVTNQDLVPRVQTFTEFFIGPNAAMLYATMWGAVGFVLLIACANLANLMLARAIGRSREVSVRMALGAGRWRIVRQLLIESVILSGLGGFFGWFIAKFGVRAYQAAMASKTSWLILNYEMDSRILWYLVAISVATGLLFGLAPALRLSKLDLNSALKDGGRSATGGGHAKHLSALLVAAEMALAVVLLAGAGVMVRSFLRIHTADVGIRTSNMVAAQVNWSAVLKDPGVEPGAEGRIAFFDRLNARLAAIPGVESVALANTLPTWDGGRYPYELADAPQVTAASRPRISRMIVGEGYFHALGATVLAGREFTDADREPAVPVAVVNERFAAKFWPGEDPMGKRLRFFNRTAPEAWVTVVGVVSNIIQGDSTRQEFLPLVYVPYRQKSDQPMWAIARTRVPPSGIITAFRHEVQETDADLDIYGPLVVDQRLEVYLDSRFYGILFLIFAAIALLLASVGLYAVIAHSVSQRTQEIGIRMAVGATTNNILSLVFRQGLLPLGVGLGVGLAASTIVNPLLKAELVGVSAVDPITLVVASSALVLSATMGCLIPARRAMRVDPVDALRHE
jgi:putative ABC transport system permease protein